MNRHAIYVAGTETWRPRCHSGVTAVQRARPLPDHGRGRGGKPRLMAMIMCTSRSSCPCAVRAREVRDGG
jgi:hypothetical protein